MNKKLLFLIAALGITVFVLIFYFRSTAEKTHAEHQTSENPIEKKEPKILYYVDPMHPTYKSDKPGIAPDCGMQLTPVYAEDSAAPEVETKKERKILYWVDPMNPSHKSDKPGKAPDGMELTPVYEEETSKEARPGTVNLSGRKQQLINLKLADVTEESIGQNIRTVGVLQYDETKIAKIHSKIEGWIDKVYADYTGKLIRKGQPLFSVYSPELVSTQQEYLLAVKAEKSLGQSEFADVSSGAKNLKFSAYQRLKLWDVSDEQIRKLEETETPMTAIIFYSPVSGFVTQRNVYEKQRITYDTETYSIADLSTIWLMADIYEYESANVQVGQKATMQLQYDSGHAYEGTVTYIYPSVNSMTRTLKARIEFRNADFQLKPDMFANVEIETGEASGLVVPEQAVLDSGERKVVFVQVSEGEFEPREVQTGIHFDNKVAILSGLSAGEKVVATGNFLLDSESQLKASLESMDGGGHQHSQ